MSSGAGASTTKGPSLTEMTALKPTCRLKGAPSNLIHCLAVEDNTDFVPSKALIRVGANGADLAGPITLNAYGWDRIKKCAPTSVSYEGQTIFAGCFVRRHDQGQPDNIVWEAHDYVRFLLSKIPQVGAGCLVWDPGTSTAVFSTRYTPRVNPQGMRNCVIRSGIPMFSWVAEARNGELSDSDIKFWTPELWLKYVRALILNPRGTWDGTNVPWWRTIDESPISWPEFSFPSDSDMNHKMPDVPMNGLKAIGALQRGLECSRSYGLKVKYGQDTASIGYYPIGSSYENSGIDLPLLRGGNIDDIKTIYDFDMSEDATEIIESAVTFGETPMVEAELLFTGTDTDPDTTTDTWIQNYSAAELNAFKYVIYGGPAGANPVPTYAAVPQTPGDTNTSNFVTCDGTGGKPYCLAGTSAAIALARQCFPRPFRSFILNSRALVTENVIMGPSGEFADESMYPVLRVARPVLEQQLTSIINDQNNEAKARYPIRLQIKYEDGNFRDVSQFTGLRCEPDGSLWIDGLTDDVNAEELIYSGSLIPNPWSATIRQMKLNVAFPMDHRVFGYAEASGQVDEEIAKCLGGPLCDIVDAPKGYRIESRVSSRPVPGLLSSYSDIIRDETQEATKHANEMVQARSRSEILSSWYMIGIRPEYTAGLFVRNVRVRGQRADDSNFKINAPLKAVTYDFIKAHTIVGGLISAGEIDTKPNRTDVNSDTSSANAVTSSEGQTPTTSSNDSAGRAGSANSSSELPTSANGASQYPVEPNKVMSPQETEKAAIARDKRGGDKFDALVDSGMKDIANEKNQKETDFASQLAMDKFKGNQSPAAVAQRQEDEAKAKAKQAAPKTIRRGDQMSPDKLDGKGIKYQAPDMRSKADIEEEKFVASRDTMTDDKKAEARGRGVDAFDRFK